MTTPEDMRYPLGERNSDDVSVVVEVLDPLGEISAQIVDPRG